MRINNINSDFLNVISGVPQGSIVGSMLFDCFFKDFFYVIETAHNFADDNTLTAFANNIQNLIHILESECSVAIKNCKSLKVSSHYTRQKEKQSYTRNNKNWQKCCKGQIVSKTPRCSN